MSKHSLLKNGAFEINDSGLSSASVASGATGKKIAAGWFFDNSPDGGTNRSFLFSNATFSPGLTIPDAGSPKRILLFGSSGSETTPGPAAQALLYQRIFGTRDEGLRYACFSFWAKCPTGKTAVIEIRRSYGHTDPMDGFSSDDIIARKKIEIDGTWRQYFCSGVFPDLSTRTFGPTDYIQVSLYVQAGSAVFTDVPGNPFVDHAIAISSSTTSLGILSTKFEMDAQLPSAFDPENDNTFRSEFLGRRLASFSKRIISASIDPNAEVNLVDPTAGNIVLTLPTAVDSTNRILSFKRIAAGSNTLTIAAAGSDTISGAASITLPNNGDGVTVISDGIASWFIVSDVVGNGVAAVGTVTSVGLTLPNIFSVAGSPVTTSGTLAGTLATQAANLVFSGPTTGAAAAPTFRALVAADIPSLNYLALSGGTLTGALTVQAAITADQLVLTQAVVTYAATTDIDFDAKTYQTISLTGNLTLTTSHRGAGKTVTVRLICDGTQRNLTFPAGWTFVGAAAPANLAASKTAILTITGFGSADSDVVAAYAAQP